MSYYLYKKKNFVLFGDKILPTCLCGDSSIRDWDGKIPYSGCLFNITEDADHILFARAEWEAARDAQLRKERDRYAECEKSGLCAHAEDIMDVNNFCGDSFNGSRRVKAMMSFMSWGRPVPISEFIEEHPRGIEVRVCLVDPRTYRRVGEEKRWTLRSEAEAAEADKGFYDLVHEWHEAGKPACVSVNF